MSKHDWRKRRERMMEDDEIYSPEELKQRKKRTAAIMRAQDARLEEERVRLLQRGYCPKCFYILNSNGKCPQDCKL